MAIIALVTIALTITIGQQNRVGVVVGASHDGYTLFMASGTDRAYLIDGEGRFIHDWGLPANGREAILRENGNLVVAMARDTPPANTFADDIVPFIDITGRIAEYTWEGEEIWSYQFERPDYRIHHGIEVMPNGNVLFIAWEYISSEEAMANGRDPELVGNGLWPDAILEYSPTEDAIVWEWHAWDHIIQDFDPDMANYGDVAANPQLADVNFFQQYQWIEDWMHVNAVDYNPELGQIALSVRELNELWIINHNITTEEARGPAGNILYRWGNPRAYQRGDESDRQIGFQHDVQWVPPGYPGEGNIILYSNRHTIIEDGEEVNYSKAIEITPPLQADGTYAIEEGEPYGPAEPTWVYGGTPDEAFYSRFISGVQRLSNGNTVINQGSNSRWIEVTPDNEIAWEYKLPMHVHYLINQGSVPDVATFRVRRYQSDYSAFDGRDMTPGPKLEDLAGTSERYPAYVDVNETVTSVLDAEVPQRYYIFETTAGKPITLRVIPDDTENSLDIQLFNEQGELIVSGQGEDAILIESYVIPEDGAYFVTISDSDAVNGQGSYEFSVIDATFAVVPEDIPRVEGDTSLGDFIFDDDPSSLFVFAGQAGDSLTITMNRSSENLSPAFQLLDVNQAEIASADDTETPGEAALTEFELPYTGIYYINTTRNDDTTFGEYLLEITIVSAND